ncbi:RICIN domain-containing protein [Nonomuraea endophytica]|uniref:RICIN domain-containing protein n=1 Tax=Nonomuraea endophytica TaxID=714136 RepID=UPI0037C77ED3
MKRTRVPLAAASLLATVLCTPSAASAQEFAWFEIIAVHSGKCLDVAHANPAHGADVIQGTCRGVGATTNQHWRFEGVAHLKGHVRVIARHSGKCLDVAHASLKHGANVLQGTCGGAGSTTNQFWSMRPVRAGFLQPFRLRAHHSGRCLDVANANLAHGADVVQATCAGAGSGNNQLWNLRQVVFPR